MYSRFPLYIKTAKGFWLVAFETNADLCTSGPAGAFPHFDGSSSSDAQSDQVVTKISKTTSGKLIVIVMIVIGALCFLILPSALIQHLAITEQRNDTHVCSSGMSNEYFQAK